MGFGSFLSSAVGIGTDLLGGWAQYNAAGHAAGQLAQAGQQAISTEQQATRDAIQAQAYETAPERNIGTMALYELASMLGIDPRQAFPNGLPGEKGGPQAPGNFAAQLGGMPKPGAPGAEFGTLNKPFTMADFFANQDPSYQFRQQQGNQAIENSAAARGMQLSGQNLKDLSTFNQQLASEEFGNAFNRYQTQQQNEFSRIGQLAGIGTSASEALGANAANLISGAGTRVAGLQTDIGSALAGGTLLKGNAISGGLNALGKDLQGPLAALGKT